MEDDIYKGYFIPKGSTVVGNVWYAVIFLRTSAGSQILFLRGMAHDPSVYPDPFNFKPERFLDAEGNLDFAVTDPQKFSFGFGRR